MRLVSFYPAMIDTRYSTYNLDKNQQELLCVTRLMGPLFVFNIQCGAVENWCISQNHVVNGSNDIKDLDAERHSKKPWLSLKMLKEIFQNRLFQNTHQSFQIQGDCSSITFSFQLVSTRLLVSFSTRDRGALLPW